MHYRLLGQTGISISQLAFGAGPVSTLMIGEDDAQQRAVVQSAIEAGINWFDTAGTYGQGQSERSLGRALSDLGAAERVHVATKVRLMPEDLHDIPGAVYRSFAASLERLQLPRVTLLQLHNSITAERGDEPTSITPHDVLGPGGVVDAFQRLRDEGLVLHVGLTGIGQAAALAEVVRSGWFATMQVPYHLLNPSAGQIVPDDFPETNYGNIIADCAAQGMGVLAIRVLAGGALAGNSPSPHTFKTPYFPLALYERDRQRAERIQELLGTDRSLPQEAIRFALTHPQIHAAIVGLGSIAQIDEALGALTTDRETINWGRILNEVEPQELMR